jgi:hypothetical protein
VAHMTSSWRQGGDECEQWSPLHRDRLDRRTVQLKLRYCGVSSRYAAGQTEQWEPCQRLTEATMKEA